MMFNKFTPTWYYFKLNYDKSKMLFLYDYEYWYQKVRPCLYYLNIDYDVIKDYVLMKDSTFIDASIPLEINIPEFNNKEGYLFIRQNIDNNGRITTEKVIVSNREFEKLFLG